MYVVLMAEIKTVVMVKRTPKGYRSESGRFYANSKLFSPSWDADKEYKTQYVVGSLQKAIQIANKQYNGQERKLYYAHDQICRRGIIIDGERNCDAIENR